MMDKVQERNWAIACHLSSLLWIPLTMIGLAIPFTNLVAPALIWYLKKDESELIDAHGKESLNFQISMTIYALIACVFLAFLMFLGILLFVLLGITDGNPWGILLTFVTGIGFFVGVISMIAIGIFQLAVVIFASLKAKDGQMYHYPFNLRLI
jgi:hypothetical protein